MWEKNALKIMDALSETAIYVIEQDTYKLLYFNRRVKEVSPEVELGKKCYKIWEGSCENCPILTIGDKKSHHTIHYNDPFGEVVDITADRVLWNDEIPAYVITVVPHKLNYEEQQGLEKIEKIYRNSLVTVFDECIIANLTEDYYVNCQKDLMWEGVPERGIFGKENRRYASLVVHPDDLETFFSYFSREAMLCAFGQGQERISKRIRRRMQDGSYHMVEFTATRVNDIEARACWCVLVFRDIHEEYIQEQKRNVEIDQLATAARVAYQMLISANLTKNTYYMVEYDGFQTKKAAESGNFDELIETGMSTVDPDFRKEFKQKFGREELLAAFERGEKQISMEMRQLGDDGFYHWNSTQVVRVNNPYSDDVLEITMTKNIDNERRQQEEHLKKERKAKKLLEEALHKAEDGSRAKSDFLSKMSHDIRTPMNAILGMTALALLELENKEKLEIYLKKIQASGNHLLGLINEVLDVSRIESGTLTLEEAEFDLRELVQDIISMVQPAAEKKSQDLQIYMQPDLHSCVTADQQHLRQVLLNILENACKYTQQNGTIRFTVEETGQPKKHVGTYRITVEDNGIGMKPEYLAHIFEPFSRADDSRISKTSGTGLGMTIVKSLVKQMGGDIKVESEYGKGSRFTVVLEMVQERTVESHTVQEEKTQDAGEDFSYLKVLLVEDNEINQQIACEMLKFLGVNPELAENGKQAVDMVEHHPAGYYDLVFMDIQMPVMNGYEAAGQIRSLKKDDMRELPIIAMTADAFSEDVQRAKKAGMDGHLAKPISIQQLKEVLAGIGRKKEI